MMSLEYQSLYNVLLQISKLKLSPKCFEFMGYNSVLKNSFEIYQAMNILRSLGLFADHDRVKSWDTHKMVDIIKQSDTSAFVLDWDAMVLRFCLC